MSGQGNDLLRLATKYPLYWHQNVNAELEEIVRKWSLSMDFDGAGISEHGQRGKIRVREVLLFGSYKF